MTACRPGPGRSGLRPVPHSPITRPLPAHVSAPRKNFDRSGNFRGRFRVLGSQPSTRLHAPRRDHDRYHPRPAHHRDGLLHAAPAGAPASAAFAVAAHSIIVAIILAVGGVLTSALVALAREWFWLRALRQPARNLNRIHQLTSGSQSETERLMRLLQDAENNVLTARAANTGDGNRHRQHPAGSYHADQDR